MSNCRKCGQPLSGVIIGHETATWHEVCPPLPTQDEQLDKTLNDLFEVYQVAPRTRYEVKSALQRMLVEAEYKALNNIINRCIEIEETGVEAIPLLVIADRINVLEQQLQPNKSKE